MLSSYKGLLYCAFHKNGTHDMYFNIYNSIGDSGIMAGFFVLKFDGLCL